MNLLPQAVVPDTGVWISLGSQPKRLENLDSRCKALAVEVLVPATVLKELTGCHINEKYRAENIQTLSFVKHRLIEDSLMILDESALNWGRLASSADADIYNLYLPEKNVKKRRDLVIAKTAQDVGASLLWENVKDKRRLLKNGIAKNQLLSLDEFLTLTSVNY